MLPVSPLPPMRVVAESPSQSQMSSKPPVTAFFDTRKKERAAHGFGRT